MAGLVPAIHVFVAKNNDLQLACVGPGSSPGRSLRSRLLHRSVLRRPGGHSGEPLPDPIPNSAVKVPCADGTKPQGLEE